MTPAATLVAYVAIVLTWKTFDLSYAFVYMAAGGFTTAVAIFAFLAYPQFAAPPPQLSGRGTGSCST